MVSATNAIFSGPETYIFPADETGKVLNWCELDGSSRGALDHAEALRRAGYAVVTTTDERERAVRIIDDHRAQDRCEDNCWTTIKAAIRKED